MPLASSASRGKSGLTRTRLKVLKCLALHFPCSIYRVATELGVDRTSTGRIIQGYMLERGLVTKSAGSWWITIEGLATLFDSGASPLEIREHVLQYKGSFPQRMDFAFLCSFAADHGGRLPDREIMLREWLVREITPLRKKARSEMSRDQKGRPLTAASRGKIAEELRVPLWIRDLLEPEPSSD